MKDERELELDDEPARQEPDAVETLVVPLWRSKFWIAGFALLGLVAGTFQSATRPNTYESVGKLLARPGAREEGSAEARVTGAMRGDSAGAREAVSNELHLLSNPVVVENVVRRIGPPRILAPYDPSADDQDSGPATRALHSFQSSWFRMVEKEPTGGHRVDLCDRCVATATAVLLRNLEVRAEPNSSVLTITCTTTSPRLSADIVDAFIAEALAHHQEVFTSSSAIAFLDERIESARSESASANTSLSDYRVQCGFYDAESQRTQILADLHSLEAQIADDSARAASLEALIGVLEEELADQGERQSLTTESAPLANPAHARLEERLTDLRLQLIAVEARRELTPRQLELERATLARQIEAAQSQLDTTSELLEGASTVQELPNPRQTTLRERLDDAHEELISLQSSTEVRKGRHEKLGRELVELERCDSTIDQLALEAKQSESRLEQYLAARDQVGVMDLLDRVNLINLRPLQAGTVALEKSGPKRGRSVMLGGLLGFAAGAAFALARPSVSRRRRGADRSRSTRTASRSAYERRTRTPDAPSAGEESA